MVNGCVMEVVVAGPWGKLKESFCRQGGRSFLTAVSREARDLCYMGHFGDQEWSPSLATGWEGDRAVERGRSTKLIADAP